MVSYLFLKAHVMFYQVLNKLEDLLAAPDQFGDFEFLSFWQVHFNYGIALAVFLAWIKVGNNAIVIMSEL